MKLPKKIKFGYLDIDVIYEPGLVKGQSLGCAARPKLQEIHIQETYPAKEKSRALFSMIHFYVNLLADTNSDEARGHRFGSAMYAVVRDNPVLAEEFEPESLKGKTLRILGQDFEVSEEPEDWQYDGYAWLAHWKIVYNGGCKPQYSRDTIIHEVYHTIDIILNLGCSEDEIGRMAFAYCLLVHQNDFSWLFDDSGEA